MDLNGSTPLDGMLRAAAEQQRMQQVLGEVMKQTLQNPQQMRRLNVSLVGVGDDGTYKVLMIATPTGERIDVPLAPAAITQIVRELGTVEAGS